MNLHKEIHFEDDIIEHLSSHGWYIGHAAGYSRELALYLPDVHEWLCETQPEEWAKVEKTHGEDALKVLSERLGEVLDKEGSLHILRRGFKHVNAKFEMCQFAPAQRMNTAITERFQQVRCTVIRQVHYSLHNNNSIDLVFFVNGIPVATAELKTDFTQNIQDAIRQYRFDRLPRKANTNADEPLLQFKKRVLVHFAVSTDEVHMTTQLAGLKTRFLPFNQGYEEGAGNPPNPRGYRTAYLWEEVLQRDNWLDILGRFVHLEKKDSEDKDGRKVTKEMLIFPRFHQWRAVTKIIKAARVEGAGHNYLIQHSAGSGKSNTIAWTAHRLASLHNAADERLFHSVIVVTDRNVLDSQLQETIYQFDHKSGVVLGITDKGGSKSSQLAAALTGNAPIIIVTLQTFPFVLDMIQSQASLRKRNFAVIADEAHSSQTGATASGLAKVLSSERLEEGEEIDSQDVMLAIQSDRVNHHNISYFAFTATPKARTLERFGRVPDTMKSPSKENRPEAFDVYSMQQAIEEGFILDVLQNYTPYKLAFKLAHNGQEYDEDTVDQAEALRSLMRWVRLHPYNISQKVQIIVEHFRANVATMLDGEARAMVVTDSRQAAVRYKLAIDQYIRDNRYDIGTLVAFSGEVNDGESGPEPFSEINMNPGLKGRDIRTALGEDNFRILLVANKYQTGFDQPLLCAMYVDKRLDGITAVQTLSRLNRTCPGKDTTYVLDFVNDPQEILESFLPYYKTAKLSGVSDPNQIHTLQNKLDESRIYLEDEVAHLAQAFFASSATQEKLQTIVAPAVDRFRVRWREAIDQKNKKKINQLNVFRKDLGTFVRMYDFLSQIINYENTELESRNIFFRFLIPLLKVEDSRELIDLSQVQLSHYKLKRQGQADIQLASNDGIEIDPPNASGSGEGRDPKKAQLREIIQQMNDVFEGEITEADATTFIYGVRDKMLENPLVREQAKHNSKDQFELGAFKQAFIDAVIESMDRYHDKASQILDNETTRSRFAALMVGLVYNACRAQDDAGISVD